LSWRTALMWVFSWGADKPPHDAQKNFLWKMWATY